MRARNEHSALSGSLVQPACQVSEVRDRPARECAPRDASDARNWRSGRVPGRSAGARLPSYLQGSSAASPANPRKSRAASSTAASFVPSKVMRVLYIGSNHRGYEPTCTLG